MLVVVKSGLFRKTLAAVSGALLVATAGCSNLSRAIGSDKSSPDEFAVVTKAPLVIPPDFSLRPPRPGAKRPQERDSSQEAASAVFSSGSAVAASPQTDGERVLLVTAGADDADSSIRDLVDSEYFTIQRTGTGFANKILFWQGETVDPGTLVDPDAEAERLRRNEDLGEPITEGETPTDN